MSQETKLNITLIDDDPIALEVMAEMLSKAGHEVNPEIAASYALPKIIRKRPDCVLVDLMMSELDGFDLCREVRGHPELSETVLVVVTALEEPYWAERAEEAGASGLITKPLDADGIKKIEEAVKAARQGRGTKRSPQPWAKRK